MKKFNSIIALMMAGLVGLSTASCSDDDLDTNPYSKGGVNLLAYGPSPILRTNEIRITGTNLQNVQQVLFVGADPVTRDQFNKSDNQNIYVNVPDASLPGQIALVAGKDTIKSITPLTFEEAIEISSITPTSNLNAGDIVTITGEYVWNVATITFTSGVTVEAKDFVSANRKEIKVKVPAAAESGTITFSDGADWELESKESLQINGVKINSVTESSDFGQTINITGVNLHTVEKVLFAGGVEAAFKVANDGSAIQATVPADAKSGAITLQAFSGAMTTSETELSLPEVAIESVSQTSDLCEGDVITVTGQNFDRIKEIFLGNQKVEDAKIEGNTITITIPEGMGDCDLKIVQNASIAPTQALAVRKLANVIWQGKETLAGWSNWGVFNWSGQLWDTFHEAVNGEGRMTIHFKHVAENPQFKVRMGDWGTLLSHINLPYFDDEICKPTPDEQDLEIDLTAEEVAAMFGDGGKGIVIWGEGIQIQYVKFVKAGAPKTIWEGNEVMNWSDNQVYIGQDAGAEFIENEVKEGQVIRFYLTASMPNWQFQVFEGHWGPQYGAWAGEKPEDSDPPIVDLDATGGCVSITVTKDMIDAALTQKWWGGIFVVQGCFCTVTKVTVAPM